MDAAATKTRSRKRHASRPHKAAARAASSTYPTPGAAEPTSAGAMAKTTEPMLERPNIQAATREDMREPTHGERAGVGPRSREAKHHERVPHVVRARRDPVHGQRGGELRVGVAGQTRSGQ